MARHTPIRYADDIEELLPDEEALIDQTIATMLHTQEQTFEDMRHATSATHAKSHGIVTGRLEVSPELPEELAQGLFASPASYEVVLRFASEPGLVDPDTVRRARGAALKVLGVEGQMLQPGWTSQDFLFNTWPVLPQGDARTYLEVLQQRDRHHGHAHRTRLGTMATHPSPTETKFDKTKNINPVSHKYYSQAAFRYGEHVAKFALLPDTEEQTEAARRTVSKNDPPGVLRDWLRDYFAEHPARFRFCVQLCTDLKRMPVEDVSREWSTRRSPYRPVATLTLPAQESFSHARRVYAEDVMSWRPWYGLVEHRPLGSINRARKRVYDALGAWRHDTNDVLERDPRTLTDVPS